MCIVEVHAIGAVEYRTPKDSGRGAGRRGRITVAGSATVTFDRHAATDLSVAYAILVPQRRSVSSGPARKEERRMTSAAIYARVSSARQNKDETIASQTAALRAHAERLGLEVLGEWVFEDEGHSGATLVRSALERLRDLVAGVGIDVVLCYSPDRLARKFAY